MQFHRYLHSRTLKELDEIISDFACVAGLKAIRDLVIEEGYSFELSCKMLGMTSNLGWYLRNRLKDHGWAEELNRDAWKRKNYRNEPKTKS